MVRKSRKHCFHGKPLNRRTKRSVDAVAGRCFNQRKVFEVHIRVANGKREYNPQKQFGHVKPRIFGVLFYDFAAALIRTFVFVRRNAQIELAKVLHGNLFAACRAVDTLGNVGKFAGFCKPDERKGNGLDARHFCHLHDKIFRLGEGGIIGSLRFENISGRITDKRQTHFIIFFV